MEGFGKKKQKDVILSYRTRKLVKLIYVTDVKASSVLQNSNWKALPMTVAFNGNDILFTFLLLNLPNFNYSYGDLSTGKKKVIFFKKEGIKETKKTKPFS